MIGGCRGILFGLCLIELAVAVDDHCIGMRNRSVPLCGLRSIIDATDCWAFLMQFMVQGALGHYPRHFQNVADSVRGFFLDLRINAVCLWQAR